MIEFRLFLYSLAVTRLPCEANRLSTIAPHLRLSGFVFLLYQVCDMRRWDFLASQAKYRAAIPALILSGFIIRNSIPYSILGGITNPACLSRLTGTSAIIYSFIQHIRKEREIPTTCISIGADLNFCSLFINSSYNDNCRFLLFSVGHFQLYTTVSIYQNHHIQKKLYFFFDLLYLTHLYVDNVCM